jgi:hypothetical protein
VRSELPTGSVTFLFTDVEGSTELLRKLGAEAYADALAEHRRLIREACAESSTVPGSRKRALPSRAFLDGACRARTGDLRLAKP